MFRFVKPTLMTLLRGSLKFSILYASAFIPFFICYASYKGIRYALKRKSSPKPAEERAK